jgi:4-hydroxy-4-methyl-2-oxoglutarate aldolase
MYTATELARARSFGAATLHEAAGRVGALPAAIKPIDPAMILAGPAYTVHVPPGDNLWIHRALYSAAKGDILVVCTSGGIEFGYWGDVLNEAAVAQGLGGLVIDGGVRDTGRLIEMPFAVFSNGIAVRGTIKGFDATAWTARPILIDEVRIMQGDLIVGDRDGVVVIPANDVAATLKAATLRVADEAAKIEKIRNGARTLDLYEFGQSIQVQRC